MTVCPALVCSWGRVFILYLDVSALVKKIFIVFFLVLIMGVFMVSAESDSLVVGQTTEIGSGEKSPDNPYKIEGVLPDTVVVDGTVYGVASDTLFGNGEIQDTYDVVTGVETRYWNLVVLDGSEEWVYFDEYFSMVENYPTYPPMYYPVECVSTHGGFITRSQTVTFAFGSAQYPFSDYWGEDKTDVSVWKQYLADQYAAGTPVSFIYRLAEPQIIQHEPILIADSDLSPLYFSLQWVIQNVFSVIQIVALDPVLMLGLSVWCIGGVVFLFRRLV